MARRHRRRLEPEVAEVLEDKSLTHAAAAERLGWTYWRVCDNRRRFKIKGVAKEDNRRKPKIDIHDRQTKRLLNTPRFTARKLAKKWGVTKAWIWKLRCRLREDRQ